MSDTRRLATPNDQGRTSPSARSLRIPEEWRQHVVPLDTVQLYPGNAKQHDLDAIRRSLRSRGQYRMAVVQRSTGYVLVGNGMVEAMRAEGWEELAVHYRDVDDTAARALVLDDNRTQELGGYDTEALLALLQQMPALDDTGYDADYLAQLVSAATASPPAGPNLAARFMVPPFSVLDARQGWWRERKRAWLELGIQSELGRANDLVVGGSGNHHDPSGARKTRQGAYGAQAVQTADGTLRYEVTSGATSVFDPVLCEIAYRWWCPPGGQVLDPYAGGSVRGIVAARLGLRYLGVDLRPEQVTANEQQRALLDPTDPAPTWVAGDCEDVLPSEVPEGYADLVFTCPPYFDLEQYSDDPRDLSNMAPHEFDAHYRRHLALAVERLAPDRFAVVVVGNVRDSDGSLRDLGALTVEAMEAAGGAFYNDAILLTPAGSLPVRAGKAFQATRVLGRTHQQVLVFVKGDRHRAARACGHLDLSAALTEAPTDSDAADVPEQRPARRHLTAAADATPLVHLGTNVWVKRDDLYLAPGTRQPGGKARTCYHLLTQPGIAGCVTAGSRQSPQVNIVAGIAQALGLPCRVHVPSGALTSELLAAQEAGAEVVQHRPGHNSVIIARARADAAERGWLEVPFGMECDAAVDSTAAQLLATLASAEPERLVVPVGSGMSLAGILHGLTEHTSQPPVLGVVVGQAPEKRLDRWAPPGWRDMATLVRSELDYHTHAPVTDLEGIPLDPVYEAKCLPYLQPGDLLWVVGRRATHATP